MFNTIWDIYNILVNVIFQLLQKVDLNQVFPTLGSQISPQEIDMPERSSCGIPLLS